MNRYLRVALIGIALTIFLTILPRAFAKQYTITQLTTYPCSGATCDAPSTLTAGTYLTIPAGSPGVAINVNVGLACGSNSWTGWLIGYNGGQWWPIAQVIADSTDSTNYPAGRGFARLTPGAWPSHLAMVRTSGTCTPSIIQVETDIKR